jgi:hypothetical protein
MSEYQTIWKILWNRASSQSTRGAPFEIADVVPAIANALNLPEAEARRKVGFLLVELGRLPEGRQYFAREGDAVVPLSSFLRASERPESALEAYPYEL